MEEKGRDAPSDLSRRGESDLVTIEAAAGAGKRVVELGLPGDTLIMLIFRGGEYFVPEGSTKVEAGDRLIVFTSKRSVDGVRRLLAGAGESHD